MQQIILLLGALALCSSPAVSGQASVAISTPEVEVTVTADQAAALAGSVIESSLRGVGRMLGAMRGTVPGPTSAATPEFGEVEVKFDERQQHYEATSAAGPRVWIDADSGEYTIDLRGAAATPGVLIEESLAAVGSMVRGLRLLQSPNEPADPGQGPLGLSTTELEQLQRTWQLAGLSAAEIAQRLADLDTADVSLRAAMRELDDSMEQLDDEMEALRREMGDLDHRQGHGGGR